MHTATDCHVTDPLTRLPGCADVRDAHTLQGFSDPIKARQREGDVDKDRKPTRVRAVGKVRIPRAASSQVLERMCRVKLSVMSGTLSLSHGDAVRHLEREICYSAAKRPLELPEHNLDRNFVVSRV